MRHTCSQDGCSQLAVERCFDCGAHLCGSHAASIQVPTYGDSLREVVCSSCLEGYLAAPGPFGPALLARNIQPDLVAPTPAGTLADGLAPGVAPA